jgi:formylglycine-generating enzyme
MRGLVPPPARTRALGLAAAFAVATLVSDCDLTVNLDGLEGGCPPRQGAGMVKVPSGSSPFCIDATETTNAEYQAFVDSGFQLSAEATPGGCAGLLGAALTGNPPPSGSDDLPVVNVNWCQAYEYCAWAGKRLCGQIGGGDLDNTFDTNATLSQWVNACSQGGNLTYPYGDTFSQSACGGQAANSQLLPVASQPACVGPLTGLFDMSGNVWEWTDCCGTGGATAFCDAMGGAFDSTETELECVGERNWTRNAGAANIGFRCCLDL